MKHGKVSQIRYWAYNYSPKWEASSRELKTLLTVFSAQYDVGVISQSMRNWKISLRGKKKTFPFPLSLLAFPFLRKIAASYQINHIFSSLVEPILIRRIGDLNTITTITKDSDSLTRFEQNIPYFKRLRYIVVESERHREILKQTGISIRNRLSLFTRGSRSSLTNKHLPRLKFCLPQVRLENTDSYPVGSIC